MATSFLLLRPRPLVTLGLTISISLPPVLFLRAQQAPLRCENSIGGDASNLSPVQSDERDAKVPIFRNGGLNRQAIRQMSGGSILGVLGGVAVGSFSRTLTFLFGLAIFGLQWLVSNGYIELSTNRIQRYVKGVNVKSVLEDNAAFKLSFGATFALAAFASL